MFVRVCVQEVPRSRARMSSYLFAVTYNKVPDTADSTSCLYPAAVIPIPEPHCLARLKASVHFICFSKQIPGHCLKLSHDRYLPR
jgi:hypothetical protein